MKPRNFLDETPKRHFVGLSIEPFLKACKMGFSFPAFYEHIVYIDFLIPPYLLAKHLIHQSLIGGICILQSEWHAFVAI